MALLLLPKKSQVFKDIQDKSGSEWISHAFGWRCSSIKEVVQLLSKHNFDNRNLSYCYRKVKQGTYDIAFYLHGKEKPRKNLGNGRLDQQGKCRSRKACRQEKQPRFHNVYF
jgi:hypothetical protein